MSEIKTHIEATAKGQNSDLETTLVKRTASEVSVIIPIFCSSEYLKRAINSISVQVRLPVEVIVVDDASPIPIEVPRPDKGEWPFQIKLVRLEQNGGGGVARNAGVSASIGRYMVFLDYDDTMHPDYIGVIEEIWHNAGSDVGAITVGFFWCDENMKPYRQQCLPGDTIIDQKSLLTHGNFVGGCSVISARRDAIIPSGGFPALRACQDWGFLLAISKRHRIMPLPVPYIYYMSPTFNPQSITRSPRRAILSICAIYRMFDPRDRGRSYQNKSALVAYHLMRARRRTAGLKVIGYSVLKFRRITRLIAKALYEGFVPANIRLTVLRFRSAGRKFNGL